MAKRFIVEAIPFGDGPADRYRLFTARSGTAMTRDMVTGETRLSGRVVGVASRGVTMFTAIASGIAALAGVYNAYKSHQIHDEVKALRADAARAAAASRADTERLACFVGREFDGVHTALGELSRQLGDVGADVQRVQLTIETEAAKAYERALFGLEEQLRIFLDSSTPDLHAQPLIQRSIDVRTWARSEVGRMERGDARGVPYVIAFVQAAVCQAVALISLNEEASARESLAAAQFQLRDFAEALLDARSVWELSQGSAAVESLAQIFEQVMALLDQRTPSLEEDLTGLAFIDDLFQVGSGDDEVLALTSAPPARTVEDLSWILANAVLNRDDGRVLVPRVGHVLAPLGVPNETRVDSERFRILRDVAADPLVGTGAARQAFGLPRLAVAEPESLPSTPHIHPPSTAEDEVELAEVELDWPAIAGREAQRARDLEGADAEAAYTIVRECLVLYRGFCDQAHGGRTNPRVLVELLSACCTGALRADRLEESTAYANEEIVLLRELARTNFELAERTAQRTSENPAELNAFNARATAYRALASAYFGALEIPLCVLLEVASRRAAATDATEVLLQIRELQPLSYPAWVLASLADFAADGQGEWALTMANQVRDEFVRTSVEVGELDAELQMRLAHARVVTRAKGPKAARGKVKGVLAKAQAANLADTAADALGLLDELAPQV